MCRFGLYNNSLYTYTQSGRPVLSVLPTALVGSGPAAPLPAVTATKTNQRTIDFMSLL